MQSYFTKTVKAALLCSLAVTTGSLLMALLAMSFTIDAIYGLYTLQYVYRKMTNGQVIHSLIEDKEEIDQNEDK